MPGTGTCTTIQQVTVSVFGQGPAKPDGTFDRIQLAGPLEISVTSGDGTFTQDAATPFDFVAKSGAAAGDTVYTVVSPAGPEIGSQAQLTDTYTLTVTADTTTPVATSIGFDTAPAQPKV